MSIVVFSGAGASIQFGLPATKEFMSVVKSQNYKSPFPDLLKYFSIKGEVPDIEKVLWELHDYRDFIGEVFNESKFKGWYHSGINVTEMKQRREYIIQLINDINKLVYETYWNIGNKTESFSEFISVLGSVYSSTVDIFTTNYDLCIEKSFNTSSDFCDGFAPEPEGLFWNASNYKDRRFKLYKLHGSINWKKTSDNRIWKTADKDFTEHKDICIIYPGYKDVPINEPFSTLHSLLEKSLKGADDCIIIGYAFRDKHINNVFAEAIQENKNLKLTSWNTETLKPDFLNGETINTYPHHFDLNNIDLVNDFYHYMKYQ